MSEEIKRGYVDSRVGSLGLYDMERPVVELIAALQRLVGDYGTDIRLELDYLDCWDEEKSYKVMKPRMETDEEYQRRCDFEKQRRAAKLEQAKALFRVRLE